MSDRIHQDRKIEKSTRSRTAVCDASIHFFLGPSGCASARSQSDVSVRRLLWPAHLNAVSRPVCAAQALRHGPLRFDVTIRRPARIGKGCRNRRRRRLNRQERARTGWSEYGERDEEDDRESREKRAERTDAVARVRVSEHGSDTIGDLVGAQSNVHGWARVRSAGFQLETVASHRKITD